MFLSFLGATCTSLNAQIDHYWSNNFNTSSALLSGAVVGGDPDASSIYYNPALISQADQANLALTANLFQYEMSRFNNALGQDLNIKRDQFNVIPRFISYTAKGGEKMDMELAVFTRNQDEVGIFEDYSTQTDILDLPDGEEFYNGELQYKRKYSDQWFSFGLSRHLSEKLTLGLGTHFPLKNYKSESELNVRAFPTTQNVTYNGLPSEYYVASTSERSMMKGWNLRLLWKLGLHYQAGDLGIGFTVTTPSLLLAGEGSIKREYLRSNIHDPNDGNSVQDAAIIDYQEKLRADLKDPFSVAIGLHYEPEGARSAIMLTAEYFAPISNYKVLEVEAGNEQANDSLLAALGDEAFLSVERGARAVFNLALGYRYKLNERVSFVGGVRTDFSSTNTDTSELGASRWFNRIPLDIYHLTLGGDIKLPRLQFVAGLQLSVAREKGISQLANFTEASEFDPNTGLALQGAPQNSMDVKYNTLSLFVGFTYNFLKK